MSDQVLTPCTTCKNDVRHRVGTLRAYCPSCKQVVNLKPVVQQEERTPLVEAVARAICDADGKVSWTTHIPAIYYTHAQAAIEAYDAHVKAVYLERLERAQAANV